VGTNASSEREVRQAAGCVFAVVAQWVHESARLLAAGRLSPLAAGMAAHLVHAFQDDGAPDRAPADPTPEAMTVLGAALDGAVRDALLERDAAATAEWMAAYLDLIQAWAAVWALDPGQDAEVAAALVDLVDGPSGTRALLAGL